MSNTVYQLIKKNNGWKLKYLNKDDLFDSIGAACAECVKRFNAEEKRQREEEEEILEML